MKIQYRILQRCYINGETEYFPHCRIKRFLFWSRWKKIAKHPSGFGLYWLPDYEHPKTHEESMQIIKDFDTWKKKSISVTNNFIEI